MSKHIGPASLGSESSDPFSAARKINGTSRDALPVLPIGDVGFGTPSMGDGGARYATGDVPPPPPPGGSGLASDGPAQTTHPDERAGMMNTARDDGSPRAQQQVRKLTPDELEAQAKSMLASMRAQPQGSSISPTDASGNFVTDANGQKLPDWLVREQDGSGGGG